MWYNFISYLQASSTFVATSKLSISLGLLNPHSLQSSSTGLTTSSFVLLEAKKSTIFALVSLSSFSIRAASSAAAIRLRFSASSLSFSFLRSSTEVPFLLISALIASVIAVINSSASRLISGTISENL